MKTVVVDLRTGLAHSSGRAARAYVRASDREIRSDMNAVALGLSTRIVGNLLRAVAFGSIPLGRAFGRETAR